MIKYKSAVNLMLLTLNLSRIEIEKICRGTVRSTDTSATGTEPRQFYPYSIDIKAPTRYLIPPSLSYYFIKALACYWNPAATGTVPRH